MRTFMYRLTLKIDRHGGKYTRSCERVNVKEDYDNRVVLFNKDYPDSDIVVHDANFDKVVKTFNPIDMYLNVWTTADMNEEKFLKLNNDMISEAKKSWKTKET